MEISNDPVSKVKKPWYRLLYVQVIIAIVCGVLIGKFWPEPSIGLKIFGDAFIALVKMIIAPVILDRKSTRLNSSHEWISRMPSSA